MFLLRIRFGAGLVLALGSLPLSAIVDRNGDGLSDVWAALYHPTQGATVDEDGDGLTNAQEALAGTDPRNPASHFAAVPPQTDAAGNLVLRWRGVWGKRYTVQSSADLKTWTALPDLHFGRGQELSAIVRAAGVAIEARRYWRVVVADVDTDSDGMTNAEEIEFGSDPTSAVGADGVLGMSRVYGAEFFVSPIGNDANPGTKSAPFRTLEKAQSAVRARIGTGVPTGGIAVWLRGGIYERSATLALVAEDSGTNAANSVDWRGYPGAEVRLVGGKRLPATAFTKVTSASPVWSRLDASARGQVRQLPLDSFLGLTADSTEAERAAAYGVLMGRSDWWTSPSALELFIDGRPMTLARWPDAETDSIQSITGDTFTIYGTSTPDVSGTYVKYATQDGVSAFRREGLSAGLQYYLRRRTFTDSLGKSTLWFITSSDTGWAEKTTPYWWCWQERPESFEPGFEPPAVPLAAGTPSGDNPERVRFGYAFTTGPVTLTEETLANGKKVGIASSFTYVGDRPARWAQATEAWAGGFWGAEWAQYHVKVARIDTVARRIALTGGPSGHGMKEGRNWFAYNLLEEITRPGEWYLERTTGMLYLWPPADFGPAAEVLVSTLEDNLLEVKDAKSIAVRDLGFEAARKALVYVGGSEAITLERLRLRNSGSLGAHVSGSGMLIRRCLFADTGSDGLYLAGGDWEKLVPGGSVVEDCEFTRVGRFQFSVPALRLGGCGQIARNNWIHDVPRDGIIMGGREITIERNEIETACRDSADSGGIYCGGDWAARGNVMRQNFIHSIHNEFGRTNVHGIYLDETISGITCEGNLLYDIEGNGFMLNCGRENVLEHNLIVRCGGALWADAWGLRLFDLPRRSDLVELHQRVVALDRQNVPWSKYPALAAIPNDWNELAALDPVHLWLGPEGCAFRWNAGWNNRKNLQFIVAKRPGQDDATYAAWRELVIGKFAVGGNLADSDPLFVDEAAGDLRLRTGSPVLAIPGWDPIPLGLIGIRE